MDELATALFWVSDRGRAALGEARACRALGPLERRRALEGGPALSRGGTAAELRATLSQDDLRARAARKTPLAERLLFVRAALEQATPMAVATDRARRFHGFARVADLGAGIGLDTLALAAVVPHVVAVERDPVRALLLRHNVDAAGLGVRVEVVEGDALASPPEAEAAFLDPDRRPGGRRERDPDRFEPPRLVWDELVARYEHLLVKLPPATRPGDHPGAGLEWVSLDGEMREARWGTGRLAIQAERRATLLPHRITLEGRGVPWPAARAPRPGDILLDPDPAVVLAGLVGDAARALGAAPVHPRIAYLLADRPAPWATCLQVLEVLPAKPAAIEAALRARGVGTLDVRARGVEESPDRWRSRLELEGPGRATLVVSRGPDDRYFAVVGGPTGSGATGGGAAFIP